MHIMKINPQLSDNNKNLALGPRWGLDTKTDWPTIYRFDFDLAVIPRTV
jgi:hypothetical protein